jgi:thioredoxin 1
MKGMRTTALILVLLTIGVVVVMKATRGGPARPAATVETGAVGPTPARAVGTTRQRDTVGESKAGKPAGEAGPTGQPLPKLLELGSVGCRPCEHMAPIIESLKKELAGRVFVKFYDVSENPAIAERFEIEIIPTQIFLDAEGRELFRHVGVLEKPEILAKMRELKMLPEP